MLLDSCVVAMVTYWQSLLSDVFVAFRSLSLKLSYISGLRPVSRKSLNFTGHFRVSQFPLYLKNGEDLSHQTSQSVCFLLPWKNVKTSAFQNKRLTVSQMAFRAWKVFGTFEKRAPGTRFSKVPKTLRAISGFTSPSVPQKWRGCKPSNLPVILISVTLRTC